MEPLIHKLHKGDERAFEELFQAFFPAGRRFVKSFLSDDAAVDDIIQDVFLQIWYKRNIFKNYTHFSAYFYKSLRNNTVKYLTRRKSTLELSHAERITEEDFFIKIVEVEFNRVVSHAISLLPEKRRQVILHAMAGMSIEEIADRLNISMNTVKVQKRKAYSTLREELKDINLHFLLMIF